MILSILLSILQLLAMVVTFIYEYKKKSISIFLWAMLLTIFGIPHLITCISDSYTGYYETLREASLYVILFIIIYLIFRIIFSNKEKNVIEFNKNNVNKNVSTSYNNKLYFTLFFMLIISIVIRLWILIRISGSITNISWATMRKAAMANGKLLNFSMVFTVLYFAGSSALTIALLNRKKKEAIFISLLILFEVIISRNRIEILPLFTSYLIMIINKYKKINFKTILIGLISFFAVIYIVYGLRAFRHYGTIKNFNENVSSISEFNKIVKEYINKGDGELGLKNIYYYFIENENNFENFNKGHTYKRMLLFLIPTSLAKDLKPSDFAISMGKAVKPNSVGYSTHPTLFGDTYANFGFAGFFISAIIWASIVNVIDNVTLKLKSDYLKLSTINVAAINLIIIGRGSAYNGFFWMMYSFIIYFFINRLIQIKINCVGKAKITND